MPDIDIVIALGLIFLIILIFVVYRIGILPKKSMPYVIGAIAAVFGLSLFRKARLRGLRKELQKREAELKIQEQKLEDLGKEFAISQRQLDAARNQLEQQKSVYKKLMLKIDATKKERQNEIERLSGKELDAAFDELLNRLDN